MKIYSVFDSEFAAYGKVLDGYDTSELLAEVSKIAMPESGTAYKPGIESLEACSIKEEFSVRAYGGMPIQVGLCWGHNTKLNCLEYHKDSELNIGIDDFILLVAKEGEIVDNHSALCPLPYRQRERLQGGDRASEGNEHGAA